MDYRADIVHRWRKKYKINAMKEINLFLTKDRTWVSNKSLMDTLLSIGADNCDILYIHTSLSFGIPNPDLKKSLLLEELLNVIKRLEVRTICMPTFTFSFCNGKSFCPESTPSRMGVLNEFFRKQEGVLRSNDPLMSVALAGKDKELVTDIGNSSCGACSTFDLLRHRDNVKFLFLGPKIGDCMTYMHYLEWLYSVDYRYERTFRGIVTHGNENKEEEYTLFVRYKSVRPNDNSYTYEQRMYENGTALTAQYGDGSISIVGEREASEEYLRCLKENPYFFVDFDNGEFIKDKTFTLNSEMVAL